MPAFISSNKWFRAGYGKKLRKLVADTTHVTSITDFGDLPVFQSATAYPMIFTAQKDLNVMGNPTTLTQAKTLDPPYPDLAALVREKGQLLPSDALDGSDWSLNDVATTARLRKMRATSIPLGEYVKGQIFWGLKTGLNKAFIIDGEQRAKLIALNPKSAEVIKPTVLGKDIRKWQVRWQDRWLIYTHRGVDISGLSAVADYLRPYREQLEQRALNQKWYELQQPQARYIPAFEGPKITWGNLSLEPRFALYSGSLYTNAPANLIPTNDLYLLGVLNSSSSRRFFEDISIQRSGNYLETSFSIKDRRCYTIGMKGGRNMAHVKTAISLDESLFREAEEWAGKLGVSRSQLFARAVEEYVRRRENEELLRKLNEAHADGLDEEEQEHLDRVWAYQARLLEETGNEWRPKGE